VPIVGIKLEEGDWGRVCPGELEVLEVTYGIPSARSVPYELMMYLDSGDGHRVLEYKGQRGERRIISFGLIGGTMHARAAIYGDLGRINGLVDYRKSKAHMLGDVLCFELYVMHDNGTIIGEWWRGKTRAPENSLHRALQ